MIRGRSSTRNWQSVVALLWLTLTPSWVGGQATPTPITSDVALLAVSSETGTLTPASPTANVSFILDAVPRVTFSVVCSVNATVQVTTPTGTIVTAATASGLGVDFDQLSLPGDSGAAEFHTEIAFGRTGTPPAAGSYTVRLSATAPPAAGAGFLVAMLPDSDIRAGLGIPAAETVTAQAVVLTAFAFKGSNPITGASATATVKLSSGGSASTITLLDNGSGPDLHPNDGLYSATFTPTAAGTYVVLGRVQKTTGAISDQFQRDAQVLLKVSDRTSRLRGDYTFATPDGNGDSRFDKLCVQTGVILNTAGEFMVSLSLAASNGSTVTAADRLVVSGASSTVLTVTIPASDVRSLGVNGPYTITSVRLDQLTDTDTVFLDQATGTIMTTPAYNLSSWDRSLVELLPNQTTSSLVDVDGDGAAEALRVSVGINSIAAGSYLTTATLSDDRGDIAATAGGLQSLSSGNQNMLFQFDGCTIAHSGVLGPYVLGDLLIAPQTTQVGASMFMNPDASFDYQLTQFCDNCAAWPNPSQCDSDGDGVGDGCVCIGDCNANGTVTANELTTSFLVLRGANPVSACPSGDIDKSGDITVAEYYKLIQLQAHYAFNPCPDGSEACIGGAPGVGGVASPGATLQLGLSDTPMRAGPNGTFSLLIGSSGPHAGAQLDIVFDTAVLSINPATDCGLGTGVSSSTHSAFAYFASSPSVPAGRQRLRVIVADKDGAAPVSNFSGGYLAFCNFFVKPSAPLGDTQLIAERPHVCDPNGDELSTIAISRTLTIVTGCTGCC